MSSQRKLDFHPVHVGHGVQRMASIRCGRCSAYEETHAMNTGIAVKAFKAKGWKIGNLVSQDRCPTCFGKIRKGAKRKRENAVERVPANPAIPEEVGAKLKEAMAPPPVQGELSEEQREFLASHNDDLQPYVKSAPGVVGVPGVTVYPSRRHAALAAAYRYPGNVHGEDFFTVPALDGFIWKLAADTTPEEREAWTQSRTYPPRPVKKKEQPMLKETTLTPSLVARTPTRDERNVIHDYLTANYDIVAQRYKAALSDAIASDALNLPRVWVQEMRVQFFGDYDRNEDAEKQKTKLDEGIKSAEAAAARLLDMAQEAEKLARDLKATRAKLGA